MPEPPPVSVAFARNLRRLRADQQWKQQELAGEAGVSTATVSAAENGQGLHLESAARLARALGVSLDEMLKTGTEAAP